ncbi:MAG: outer membrane beta-barrel protein [Bacteroidota bacterium]
MKAIAKKYAMIAVFLCGIYALHAQTGVSGGLMGGLTMGAVEIKDLDEAFTNNIEGDMYGFEAGLYMKFMLSPLYIKPMALYNFRSGSVEYNDASNNTRTDDISLHKIEVPVLLGLNLVGPLNIEAGPVYNYLLSVTDEYNSQTVDVGRNGLGYRAGANLELGGLTLGLSYQGAFYSSGSSNATFYEPYKVILGLGIRLGGPSEEEK